MVVEVVVVVVVAAAAASASRSSSSSCSSSSSSDLDKSTKNQCGFYNSQDIHCYGINAYQSFKAYDTRQENNSPKE